MQFNITLSDNEKYILCVITGTFTAAEAQKFLIEMDAVSRANKCKKFLLDMRNAINVSDVVENYDFAYNQMNRLNLQRDVRLAVLTSPGDHSHDFVETAVSNAGYGSRLFSDEVDAIAWLENDRVDMERCEAEP